MEEHLAALRIFAAAFTVASLGGLSQHLNTKELLTARGIIAAGLLNGISGLVVALLWYVNYQEQGNLYYLVGLSGLTGLTGPRMLDGVLTAVAAIRPGPTGSPPLTPPRAPPPSAPPSSPDTKG